MSGLPTIDKCRRIAESHGLRFQKLYAGTKLVAKGHDRHHAYVYVAIESQNGAASAMEAALRSLPLKRGAK